jgi:hypothetical protein
MFRIAQQPAAIEGVSALKRSRFRGHPYPTDAYVAPGGVIPPAISKSYMEFALPATEKHYGAKAGLHCGRT